jgi:hypothetical protein
MTLFTKSPQTVKYLVIISFTNEDEVKEIHKIGVSAWSRSNAKYIGKHYAEDKYGRQHKFNIGVTIK